MFALPRDSVSSAEASRASYSQDSAGRRPRATRARSPALASRLVVVRSDVRGSGPARSGGVSGRHRSPGRDGAAARRADAYGLKSSVGIEAATVRPLVCALRAARVSTHFPWRRGAGPSRRPGAARPTGRHGRVESAEVGRRRRGAPLGRSFVLIVQRGPSMPGAAAGTRRSDGPPAQSRAGGRAATVDRVDPLGVGGRMPRIESVAGDRGRRSDASFGRRPRMATLAAGASAGIAVAVCRAATSTEIPPDPGRSAARRRPCPASAGNARSADSRS